MEYCKPNHLINKEQYYFYLLKPEFNILQFARSMPGLKDSTTSIEKMREANVGCMRSETICESSSAKRNRNKQEIRGNRRRSFLGG